MVASTLVAASSIPIILLGISAIHDLCCRRVPNYLIGVLAIIGLAYPWIPGNSVGVFSSYLGGFLGLLIFLPPYIGKFMGAGDVKALAVSGLYVGVERILILALYSAVAGGFLALIYLLWKLGSKYFKRGSSVENTVSQIELPYVVAIFGGLFFMLMAERMT